LFQNVKLDKTDHPFAHLFDKSMPDPAKTAAPARRTQDYWETDPKLGVYIRHHCQPRKSFYAPDDEITKFCKMQPSRCTVRSSNDEVPEWDVYRNAGAWGTTAGKKIGQYLGWFNIPVFRIL